MINEQILSDDINTTDFQNYDFKQPSSTSRGAQSKSINDKYSDRKREYYRFNVLYNKLASHANK